MVSVVPPAVVQLLVPYWLSWHPATESTSGDGGKLNVSEPVVCQNVAPHDHDVSARTQHSNGARTQHSNG